MVTVYPAWLKAVVFTKMRLSFDKSF